MLGASDLCALLARLECSQQTQSKLLENCKKPMELFGNDVNFVIFLVHGTFGDISLYSVRVVRLVAGVAWKTSRRCQISDGSVVCWFQEWNDRPHAHLAQNAVRTAMLRRVRTQRLLQIQRQSRWCAMVLLHDSHSAGSLILQVFLPTRMHAHLKRHNPRAAVLRVNRAHRCCDRPVHGTFLHHSTYNSAARWRKTNWSKWSAINKSFDWAASSSEQGTAATCSEVKRAWQSEILSEKCDLI